MNNMDIPSVGVIKTSQTFHQLGIFVLDGSGSMTEDAEGGLTKAASVNVAIRELLSRFKVSKVRDNFSFSVIKFDNSASLYLSPISAEDADDNADYDPIKGHGGGTNIYTGIELAGQIAEDFLNQAPNGGVPYSVIILLMSDGMCFDPTKTQDISDKIKNSGLPITICTCYLGKKGHPDPQGEALMRSLANDPVMGYKTVYDAETLRKFFEASISAAAGGIQIG